jgi:hypothetical protein
MALLQPETPHGYDAANHFRIFLGFLKELNQSGDKQRGTWLEYRAKSNHFLTSEGTFYHEGKLLKNVFKVLI